MLGEALSRHDHNSCIQGPRFRYRDPHFLQTTARTVGRGRKSVSKLGIQVSLQHMPGLQVHVPRNIGQKEATKGIMWILHEEFLTPNPSTSEADLQQLEQKYAHPASLVPRLSVADFHFARVQPHGNQRPANKGHPINAECFTGLGYDVDLPESPDRPFKSVSGA